MRCNAQSCGTCGTVTVILFLSEDFSGKKKKTCHLLVWPFDLLESSFIDFTPPRCSVTMVTRDKREVISCVLMRNGANRTMVCFWQPAFTELSLQLCLGDCAAVTRSNLAHLKVAWAAISLLRCMMKRGGFYWNRMFGSSAAWDVCFKNQTALLRILLLLSPQYHLGLNWAFTPHWCSVHPNRLDPGNTAESDPPWWDSEHTWTGLWELLSNSC